MTPREPDRYEAKAREATDRCLDRDGDKPAGFACVECIAAALRAEARDTRQDAIDVIRSHVAAPLAAVMVRALIQPAAPTEGEGKT